MAKTILSADGMITVLSLLPHLVTAASSGAGIDPLCLANHCSQKLKKKIQVQQPNMIKVYKHFMGGVQRADENIDKYPASVRGK